MAELTASQRDALADALGHHLDRLLMGAGSGSPTGLLNMPSAPDPLAGVRAVARRALPGPWERRLT